MENKIENLKKERKDIINDYSGKITKDTLIEDEIKKIQDLQYVLVKEVIWETEDVKSFILIPDKTKGTNFLAPFKAGQYISLKLNLKDSYVTRAYSLSSSPKEANAGIYRITIKRVKDGLVSNYMLDEIEVGDHLTISNPAGEFGYNKIKDEANVIGIAGGSGITPFLSLAKAVIDGDELCDLNIIYSVRTYDDIIFKKEIEELNKKSKNVKIHITLTREEKEGFLNGYINKEMIKPYVKEFNTILMCGPKALYQTMNEILAEFNIPRKSVRYENFSVEYQPEEVQTYELKVVMNELTEVIPCKSDETLLVSLEKANIKAPSMCRIGVCGFCRSILLEGKIKMIGAMQATSLSENDYIHPCVTYPESNIVLKLDI